jgi:hypothetical protein
MTVNCSGGKVMEDTYVTVAYEILVWNGEHSTRTVKGEMTVNLANVSPEFEGDPTVECIHRLDKAYAQNGEHLIKNECYAWRKEA